MRLLVYVAEVKLVPHVPGRVYGRREREQRYYHQHERRERVRVYDSAGDLYYIAAERAADNEKRYDAHTGGGADSRVFIDAPVAYQQTYKGGRGRYQYKREKHLYPFKVFSLSKSTVTNAFFI